MIPARNSIGDWSLAAVGCLVFVAGETAAQYVDTKSGCVQCHKTALPQNDFCAVVSAETWARDDKHARAFYLLHETDPADPQQGAAKRALVQRILGFELREAFADDRYSRLQEAGDAPTAHKVATVKSCLRCHATWPKAADEQHPLTPPVTLDLGVSCQACHGPGEKWEPPHRLPVWRLVTPEGKASLGFFDCRSVAAKAGLCASCHVGSVAEDKFVKHEWYAAGHPPLPGFELASFQSQMPVHWKSLREKGEFAFRAAPPGDNAGQLAMQMESLKRSGVASDAIKNSYLEANFPESVPPGLDPAADLAKTRDAIVSAAVLLETYVRLVGDYAAEAAAGRATWPELALYDCSACHHELRSGLATALRPKRSHTAGRPPLSTWPIALAKLAAQQAAGYDAAASADRWSVVQSKLFSLEFATTQRPFGDFAAMRDVARPLADSLAQLAADATNTRFDQVAATKALKVLTRGDTFEANDFASARQAAWAILAIASDLGHSEAAKAFGMNADDPLALRLPSGPEKSVMDNLGHWLPAAGRYDPAWFRRQLEAILLIPDSR
jgi:Cytochrome c554 and c-prime